MLGFYWLDTAEKETRVIHQNLHSNMSSTSDKVRHIIGLTLVCVSIHLECWLNKSRVEIVTWAVVGVAFQQQFSYNCVSKFWQCESNRCRFNWLSMSIGCMRIQFTFKQWVVKGIKSYKIFTCIIYIDNLPKCTCYLVNITIVSNVHAVAVLISLTDHTTNSLFCFSAYSD